MNEPQQMLSDKQRNAQHEIFSYTKFTLQAVSPRWPAFGETCLSLDYRLRSFETLQVSD